MNLFDLISVVFMALGAMSAITLFAAAVLLISEGIADMRARHRWRKARRA